MQSPTQIDIPVLCAEVEQETLLWSLWSLYNPPTQLNQLVVL
jgi:hypothetical protein